VRKAIFNSAERRRLAKEAREYLASALEAQTVRAGAAQEYRPDAAHSSAAL